MAVAIDSFVFVFFFFFVAVVAESFGFSFFFGATVVFVVFVMVVFMAGTVASSSLGWAQPPRRAMERMERIARTAMEPVAGLGGARRVEEEISSTGVPSSGESKRSG